MIRIKQTESRLRLSVSTLRTSEWTKRMNWICSPRLSVFLGHCVRRIGFALLAILMVFPAPSLFAKTYGTISGTARDSQGAVVPGTNVQLRNINTNVIQTSITDQAGFYSFSVVDVGTYSITFEKTGFKQFSKTNLVIHVDTSLQVDAELKVGDTSEQVTVTATNATVDTETNQVGEVIGGTEMADLPLGSRAYTDLLILQPGVVPISTSQYGTISPDNSLDNGLLSMGGARDINSGFMINGANVVEGFGGGTPVIPNLDSISEFRIVTSNAGAEYGNYAGGQVNVVTKSGTNKFHGDAFEFFQNVDLNALVYDPFAKTPNPDFRQNVFGGTFGGPILRKKAFFFVDYQGTRFSTTETLGGTVPTAAQKGGDFSSPASEAILEGSNGVNGSYWATALSNRLGYTVTNGEPYYVAGCTSSSQCVFPSAQIPKTALDPVAANYLSFIPDPNTPDGTHYQASGYASTLQDDKGGLRIDFDTRVGRITGYYHDDPWINLIPAGVGGGTSLPGFPGNTVGGAQLATFGVTTPIGKSIVNQFTASYIRNLNTSGQTTDVSPSLSQLGFADPSAGGIYQLAPAYQNYPTLIMPTLTLGPPEAILTQANDTYQFQDDFIQIVGNHTLKFGGDYHWDLVDFSRPDMKVFLKFNGNETGSSFADFLLGASSSFFQATPASVNLRNFYLGAYGEDSWRVSTNLTVNYGLRWDVNPYWAEQHDKEPVFVAGLQSVKFPGAPAGYVFPGDPGVPRHMANIRWNDFAPRFGFAYAPDTSNHFLQLVFGAHGQSSIRGGYGLYYTNIEGSAVYSFSSAPYGFHYSSPAPTFLSRPFINRANGTNNGQRFPLPTGSNIDWAEFEPISGIRAPLINSPSPYVEHVDLSFERKLEANSLLTVNYVGTFGHHLTLNADNNPGNQALCLSLSQPGSTLDGNLCGPGGESEVYYPTTGGTVYGTREPFGFNFLGNGVQLDTGNSSYHALEATLRHTSSRFAMLLSYTYSKAMDEGSGFGEQVILYPDGHVFAPRALSAFDLTHNFAGSYTYELPFDHLTGKNNRFTRGWKLSGVSEFTTGLPITMYEMDDNSLLGGDNNSGYYGTPDIPAISTGNIWAGADKNMRHSGSPNYPGYFNTSLFSQEPLGGLGNSSRRFFHGPGIDNWDLALLKDVKIHEGMSLECRTEFYDAFNHAQFNGNYLVDGNLSDGLISQGGTFGLGGSAVKARSGQLAIKLMF
jgi:hypothetical protein